jgi:hypothetical protein
MRRVSCVVLCWLGLGSGSLHAYDFEVEVETTGQGYEQVWYRPGASDVRLQRRRFTQALRLHIWDLLGPSAWTEPAPKAPIDLYVTTSLRLDHDFGAFTQGLIVPDRTDPGPAYDLVPELDTGRLALDVLFAYVGGRTERVEFELGRQVAFDTFDAYAFDGLHLRARTPWWLAVEAHGGLLVRERSTWGSPTAELDGTSGDECRVFDASAGDWVVDVPQDCRQRQELLPMFGAAVETLGLGAVQARLSYRRVQSRTPDALYPDTGDQAPPWGVNEEKVALDIRGNFRFVVPWAAARWNFVLGQIDELHVGARLGGTRHVVTPQLVYSYPSFDADSIFNVFTMDPYTDLRLAYELCPGRGAFRASLRGFVRRFDTTYATELLAERLAAGVGVSGRYRRPDGQEWRLDVFHDDGFGGLRSGGSASARVPLGRDFSLDGRISAVVFDEDLLAGLHGTSVGAQAGGRWILGEGVALHLLLEENVNRLHTSQFRAIAVLDLAFLPEL